MLDKFDRNITYLRISITDRCNLRCVYCMPEDGVKLKSHGDIMSFEDICKIVETGTAMGIRKVRLTGGEPLVR
ncbi:MAG: radical SAM protein, partial [Spirochaetales bacterium]|nr:radical SAM protein [Spirochaetales bacterium]